MKSIIKRISVFTVAVGSIGLLIAMFLGVGDVIGTFFNRPLNGALEITESTMVLIVFGGLAYAQIRRGHIRVELFYMRAGPRLRSCMDIVASISGVIFFSLVGWQAINETFFSWDFGESTNGLFRLPLYPARAILAFGVILMVVQLVLDLFEDVKSFGSPREIHF
jgi:TRAP-type transport system small permease protein|tara:strand:- start:4204 stop:4698 length:495 start_codon:yes stop_codon:yes gene_type:complete